jgi:uncharacterized membrane protein
LPQSPSGVLGIASPTLYFPRAQRTRRRPHGHLGNFYSPLVIVLSFSFLGEALSAVQLLGFVLVSLGVWVAAWPREARSAGRPAHAMRGFLYALLAIALMASRSCWSSACWRPSRCSGSPAAHGSARSWRCSLIAAARGELAALGRSARASRGRSWLAALHRPVRGDGAVDGGLQVHPGLGGVRPGRNRLVFILLLAALWLKEPLTRRSVTGVVLTFGGVCFMLWVR